MASVVGLVGVSLVLVLGAVPALGDTATPTRPPNIVLIVADDHGFPYSSFMGHSIVKTPSLDRLAQGGTLFRIGYNTGTSCEPSLRTLLDGTEPYKRREGWRQVPRFMPLSVRSLPGLAAKRGYKSFQAGKYWPRTHKYGGFTQGTKDENSKGRPFLRAMGGQEGLEVGRTTMAPVDAFLDQVGDDPFFLWFAPAIPHGPWNPPAKYLELYGEEPIGPEARAYFASISWLDDVVGRLVADLKRRGLLDDTLIIYLSDNGQGPFPFEGDPFPVKRRSKSALFELGMRTPVIFYWPGRVPAGVVRDDLLSTLDIVPTLLGYAGAKSPVNLSGRDIRDAIEKGTPIPREKLIGRARGRVHGFEPEGMRGRDWGEPKLAYYIRDDRWHYIWYDTVDFDLLFDLANDPHERVNVASAHPERVKEFRAVISEWLSAEGLRDPRADPAPAGPGSASEAQDAGRT